MVIPGAPRDEPGCAWTQHQVCEAGAWGSSDGPSPRGGVQELAWARDQNVAEPPELEEMLVTGHDRVGLGRQGAFEDPVVSLVLLHNVEQLPGVDHNRKSPNRPHSLTDARRRPPELPDQDGLDSFQDRRG
jgi:hypothetical protein